MPVYRVYLTITAEIEIAAESADEAADLALEDFEAAAMLEANVESVEYLGGDDDYELG